VRFVDCLLFVEFVGVFVFVGDFVVFNVTLLGSSDLDIETRCIAFGRGDGSKVHFFKIKRLKKLKINIKNRKK
jgi:hypothetical protein